MTELGTEPKFLHLLHYCTHELNKLTLLKNQTVIPNVSYPTKAQTVLWAHFSAGHMVSLRLVNNKYLSNWKADALSMTLNKCDSLK